MKKILKKTKKWESLYPKWSKEAFTFNSIKGEKNEEKNKELDGKWSERTMR